MADVLDRFGRRPPGYFDLIRDLAEPGCPVCRGVHRAAERYLAGLLWENVNDPELRASLRASHGFCREHTGLVIEIAEKEADQLGIAILYEDLLRHARDDALAAAKGQVHGLVRRRWRPDPARLQSTGECPACRTASLVAERYIRLLAACDATSRLGAAGRSEGRGLCLPHLMAGLPVAGDQDGAERLLEIYLRGEEETRTQLSELKRKHDYRRVHEPPGRERDAWRRAPEVLVGERDRPGRTRRDG